MAEVVKNKRQRRTCLPGDNEKSSTSTSRSFSRREGKAEQRQRLYAGAAVSSLSRSLPGSVIQKPPWSTQKQARNSRTQLSMPMLKVWGGKNKLQTDAKCSVLRDGMFKERAIWERQEGRTTQHHLNSL